MQWGPGWTGGVFKGKRALDIWFYDRHGVQLVFEGDNLVAWRTDKTVEQLRAIPKR